MGIKERGLADQGGMRHRHLGKAMLLVVALLSLAGVQAVTAAGRGTAGVNRTIPKVTAPSELQFSSPPLDAEFLRTGLFAEPLAPVAATTPPFPTVSVA